MVVKRCKFCLWKVREMISQNSSTRRLATYVHTHVSQNVSRVEQSCAAMGSRNRNASTAANQRPMFGPIAVADHRVLRFLLHGNWVGV